MVAKLMKFSQNTRHTRDRWLHPLRRRAARRTLANLEGSSILVACHGNICRSPFAEAVLRAALPASTEVRSAGFIAPGRCPPPFAISAARRFGFDLARHCSRLLTPGLVRSASLIIVMEPDHARELIDRFGASPERVLVLSDLDPLPIESRGIADPVMQSRDFFIDCYDQIDRCGRELSRILYRSARQRAPMYGEEPVSEPISQMAS